MRLLKLLACPAILISLAAAAHAAPIGFWRMEGTPGTTIGTVANEISPGTLDGAGLGGGLFSSDVPNIGIYNPLTGARRSNTSSLDTINGGGGVRIANNPLLDVDSFTVQAFMKLGDEAGTTYPSYIRRMQSSNRGWQFDKDPQEELRIRIDTGPAGNGQNQVIGSSSSFFADDGEWHHVALTYNQDIGQAKFYFDYTTVATRNISAGLNGWAAVGKAQTNLDIGLNGSLPDGTLIDEVYYVNEVLLPGDFLQAVTPEPSAFLLAAFGLLGLSFFGRRRKR